MGESVVDGNNGAYKAFDIDTAETVHVGSFKIQAFKTFAFYVQNADLTLDHIEVDGFQSVSGGASFTGGALVLGGIAYGASNRESTVDLSDIYVHDLSSPDAVFVAGVRITAKAAGFTTHASAHNVTIARITSTLPSTVQSFGFHLSGDSGGTLIADMGNITVDGMSSTSPNVSAAISAVGVVFGSTGTIQQVLQNVTIHDFNVSGDGYSGS